MSDNRKDVSTAPQDLGNIIQRFIDGAITPASFEQSIREYVSYREFITRQQGEQHAATDILSTVGSIPSYHILMKNYDWFHALCEKYNVKIS